MLFSEIIGQERVKQRLLQSVKDGRIPHAQLFFGPEGCGHLPLAIAYAQYLSCESRTENDSCNRCGSCIKYKKIAHPDLHFSFPTATMKDRKAHSDEYMAEWRKAVLKNPYLSLFDWYESLGIENKQGYMSVEESGDILHKLLLKPYESQFKVMIIWMAEKMRADAANKLLKIIEEPPDDTLFILITENMDQMLGTITSRTQLIKMKRIDDDVLQKLLQSEHGLDFHQARHIVRLSEGNYNMALSLANQENAVLNIETEFMNWMRMCYAISSQKTREENYMKLNEWIEQIIKGGRERQKNFLLYGLEVIRECLVHNYADASMARIDDEMIAGFSRFAPFIHYDNAADFEKELSRAGYHIERNANPRILFLDLSFKLNALLRW